MKPKQDTNFWPAYSDLMTSLFFIMLVLFVLSFFLFKSKDGDLKEKNIKLKESLSEIKTVTDSLTISNNKYKKVEDSLYVTVERLKKVEDSLAISLQKYKKILMIDSALMKLDGRYFIYNSKCKRHELNVDVLFNFNRYDLNEPYLKKYHKKIIEAGKHLKKIINSINPKDNIKYLLVIEGRAGRYKNEEENERFNDRTKYLSYARAKSLYDFWEQKGISFNKDVCEVIIAGSGFFGQCRHEQEIKNRRFVIQILPKVGSMEIK